MSPASHLYLSRHGIFYFRLVFSDALRARLNLRQRELRISLRTRERAVAIAHARLIHVKIDKILSEYGDTMATQQPVPMSYDIELDPVTGRIVKVKDVRADETEEVKALLKANMSAAPALAPVPGDKHKLVDAPLSEAVNKYLAHYKPTVKPPTYERRRGHLGVFVEYFGDCKMSALGRARISEFWDDLPYLPPQREVRPGYRDMKLAAVLQKQKALAAEEKQWRGLSAQTQAHYREAVSGFYAWCAEREIVGENIAARKTKRTKRYAEEVGNEPREAYSADDLKRIFEHPLFRLGKYDHPYQYWVPHIALFTGARINEIAQLYVEDIYQDEGCWVFEFCRTDGDEDAGGSRVRRPDTKGKTDAARRLTPVHPTLIELGLLDFCNSVRAEGHQRLFPELPYSRKGGYGTRASRWYMEAFLRPKVGITNPSKVFHSFRHTVIDRLGDMLFDRPEGQLVEKRDMLIKAVVGHKMQDITFGHYKKQFHPRVTSMMLNPLTWDIELTPYTPIARKAPPVRKAGLPAQSKTITRRPADDTVNPVPPMLSDLSDKLC